MMWRKTLGEYKIFSEIVRAYPAAPRTTTPASSRLPLLKKEGIKNSPLSRGVDSRHLSVEKTGCVMSNHNIRQSAGLGRDIR